jgi:antitoxin PrlF
MLAKVTSKGQITIPNEIRNKLGITRDDMLDFRVEDGRIIMVPVKTLKDLRGTFQARGTGGFFQERATAKDKVAARVREEME